MPEISFYELILIAIVGLLVIGPERLPETLRTLGLWFGRMRRSFNAVKTEIEKEIGMDEVKRQLHNEAIMEEMKRIEAEVKNTADVAKRNLNEGIQATSAAAGTPDAAQVASGNQASMATQTELPGIDPGVDGDISDLIAAQDGGVPTNTADIDTTVNDDRDHSDAGAQKTAPAVEAADAAETDDRDHTDAGAEDASLDPTASGAQSGSKPPASHRVTSG